MRIRWFAAAVFVGVLMLAGVREAAALYVSCVKCHALPESQAWGDLVGSGQSQGHGSAFARPLEVVCMDCHDTWNHEQNPGPSPYPPYFLWRSAGPDSPLTNACTNCHGSPHVAGPFIHPNDFFTYYDETPPAWPLLPQPPTSILPLFAWEGFPLQEPVGGGVVCSTCHNPHLPGYPLSGRSKFLRVGDIDNPVPLCNSCHMVDPPAIGSSLFIPSVPGSVQFSVDAQGDLEIAVTLRNRGNDFAYVNGSVYWQAESGNVEHVGGLGSSAVPPDWFDSTTVAWSPPPDWDPAAGNFRFVLYNSSSLDPFTPNVFVRGINLPPAPENLRVTGASPDSIDLAWDQPPVFEPLAWEVYRDNVKITPWPVYAPTFTDFGLAPDTPHVYRVVSKRLDGGLSSPPSEVGGTTAPAFTMIRVPQDFPTIQAAIDAAFPGTSIHVAPGTYAEPLNLDGRQGITIKGQDANACVLDYTEGPGPLAIRLGWGDSGNTLSGFTVRNGVIEMDAGDVVAASVLVADSFPSALIMGGGLVAQCTFDAPSTAICPFPGGMTVVNSIFLGPSAIDAYCAPPQATRLLNNDFPSWLGWSAYAGSGNFSDMPQFMAPGPPVSHLPATGSPTCGLGFPLGMDPVADVGAFQCGMPYTPKPPADLVATFMVTSPRRVELVWTPSIDAVMDYFVYRSTDPGFPGTADTQPYDMVPGVFTSWEDYSVVPGVTYYYRVRAHGGPAPPPVYELVSAPTNTASALDASSAPVAQDDTATVAEDLAIVIPVLANDSDLNGDEFHIHDVGLPENGFARMLPDETIEYTPWPDFFGTDSFTYTVQDVSGGLATATVTVTVTPVNDPPYAVYDTFFVDEDTPISRISFVMRNNDWDPEADYPLTQTVASPPSHGTLVQDFVGDFSYHPAPDFHGTDSFTYVVTDSLGAVSAPGTVTITVRPVNDAPVANGQAVAVAEDGSAAVTLSGSDIDGDALSFAVAQPPAHGTLSGYAPNLTYVPAANYDGPDSFTFTVSDGQATSAAATVAITVTPVNDAPVAGDDAYATAEDTVLSVPAPGVLGNDTDIDGGTLSAILVAGPAHGTVALDPSGAFVYTPTANYNGPDFFSYLASDGQASSGTATVTIQVSAVNDAPVADVSPDEQSFKANSTVTFSGAPSFDVDGTIVSYSWNFGDGTTATGATVTKRYKKIGVYIVTLTVSDDLGATDTDTGRAIVTK